MQIVANKREVSEVSVVSEGAHIWSEGNMEGNKEDAGAEAVAGRL